MCGASGGGRRRDGAGGPAELYGAGGSRGLVGKAHSAAAAAASRSCCPSVSARCGCLTSYPELLRLPADRCHCRSCRGRRSACARAGGCAPTRRRPPPSRGPDRYRPADRVEDRPRPVPVAFERDELRRLSKRRCARNVLGRPGEHGSWAQTHAMELRDTDGGAAVQRSGGWRTCRTQQRDVHAVGEFALTVGNRKRLTAGRHGKADVPRAVRNPVATSAASPPVRTIPADETVLVHLRSHRSHCKTQCTRLSSLHLLQRTPR